MLLLVYCLGQEPFLILVSWLLIKLPLLCIVSWWVSSVAWVSSTSYHMWLYLVSYRIGSGELARELKYSCHSWSEIIVSSADLVVFYACVVFLLKCFNLSSLRKQCFFFLNICLYLFLVCQYLLSFKYIVLDYCQCLLKFTFSLSALWYYVQRLQSSCGENQF